MLLFLLLYCLCVIISATTADFGDPPFEEAGDVRVTSFNYNPDMKELSLYLDEGKYEPPVPIAIIKITGNETPKIMPNPNPLGATISRDSGEFIIYVHNSQDYEGLSEPTFSMRVVALQEQRYLRISIKDIDDTPPVISLNGSSCEVEETTLRGTGCVHTITDVDTKLEDITLKVLESGKESLQFALQLISETTENPVCQKNCGLMELIVTEPLNFGITPVYSLVLQAVDLGNLTATISYIVQVVAVNKDIPTFSNNEIVIEVDENTAGFIEFHKQLYVEDLDSGMFGVFVLTLEDFGSGYREPFIAVPSEAYQKTEVRLAVSDPQKLDYEDPTWRNISFAIVAAERDNASRTSSCSIMINLIDINDESPIFPKSEYIFNVSENTPLGDHIGTVLAKDADTGDIVKHSLGSDKHFHIEEISGDMTVNALLDYETQKEIIVTVIAEDSALPLPHTAYTTARINILDLNDEPPRISVPHSQPRVKESTKVGKLVDFIITADDVDTTADLYFKILWENSTAFYQGQEQDESLYIKSFEIVPTTIKSGKVEGRLMVKRELDWSKFDTLYAVIEVEDIGTELEYYYNRYVNATLSIIIEDENTYPPEFINSTLESMQVYENAQNNTLIGTISAEDKDGPPFNIITYSLIEIEDTPTNSVYINRKNGEIRVSGKIDFEKNQFLTYLVEAADADFVTNATLNITVIDVNDNPPVPVGDYNQVVEVPEDWKNVEWIFQVNATDADTIPAYRTVYYTMDRRFEDHSIFGIDRYSGIMYVNNTGTPHLDYEGNPPDGYYELDITIADNEMANDPWESNKNIAKVRINVTDVNDNPPILLKVEVLFNTSQDAIAGEVLGKVTAIDIDSEYNRNNYVWFKTLDSSIEMDYFELEVEPQNQLAYIIANKTFNNCPSGDQHTLNIYAYNDDDRNQTDTRLYKFSVHGINQHYPTFLDPSNTTVIKSYVEEIDVGNVLYEIQVIDEDDGINGTVTCNITGDDSALEYLYLDQNAMSITVRLRKPVTDEVELPFMFQLIIEAEDSCEPEDCRLSTIVTPKMEFVSQKPSDPIFKTNTAEMSYTENSTDPQLQLLPVNASYPDNETQELYYNLFNKGDAALFNLDSITGELSLKEPKLLDREETEWLYIFIVASRSKEDIPEKPNRKSFLNITIHVLDIIDVAPVFEDSEYSGAIKFGSDLGKRIFIVNTFDPDLNDSVTYSIKEDSIRVTDSSLEHITNPFKFEDGSNVLILNFHIKSSSITGNFQFVIMASDKANLTNEVMAKVYIISEDDTVTFRFYNNVTYVTSESSFIAHVFREITGRNCSIEDIQQARDDTNADLENVIDLTMLFINVNSSEPVKASEITLMLSAPAVFYKLKTKLSSEALNLIELKDAPTDTSDPKTLQMVLILITVVTGTLFIVVVAIFFYRTARLNRRLEALSTTRFGSQESGLNRVGMAVPNTNQHAVEGSNPVYGNEEITTENYDAMSQSSGDSDLIGIEENPEFNQHGASQETRNENVPKDQDENVLVDRRVSLNPLSASGDMHEFGRRDSINPLASKCYEEYDNLNVKNPNFTFMQRSDSTPTTDL